MTKDKVYKDEAEYQRRLVLALQGFGIRTQVHDRCAGTNDVPDLSFAGCGKDGWIEVKYLPAGVPKMVHDIKHFTQGQKDWLMDFSKAGSGFCYLWIGAPNQHVWVHPIHFDRPILMYEEAHSNVDRAASVFKKMLESYR
jgi:hypothetical protein